MIERLLAKFGAENELMFVYSVKFPAEVPSVREKPFAVMLPDDESVPRPPGVAMIRSPVVADRLPNSRT
jgi:hypothetical protein